LINIKEGDAIAAVSVVNKTEEETPQTPAEGEQTNAVEQASTSEQTNE
jgi:hypothetical protein